MEDRAAMRPNDIVEWVVQIAAPAWLDAARLPALAALLRGAEAPVGVHSTAQLNSVITTVVRCLREYEERLRAQGCRPSRTAGVGAADPAHELISLVLITVGSATALIDDVDLDECGAPLGELLTRVNDLFVNLIEVMILDPGIDVEALKSLEWPMLPEPPDRVRDLTPDFRSISRSPTWSSA